jgi:superfamily II RNA helicase
VRCIDGSIVVELKYPCPYQGAVMEVLVSRMKAYSSQIRFIAVSATIPNAADFALWIGKRDNEPKMIGQIEQETFSDDAAQLYTFSEAFRPCPLKKVCLSLDILCIEPDS